jgi:Leucine-rich repeat (LRR) protein
MNRIAWGGVQLSALTSLRHLDLSNNKTPSVHPSLWGLVGLTHLDLSHNSIDRIDPQISALTGLQVRRRRRGGGRGCVRKGARGNKQGAAGSQGRRLTCCHRAHNPRPQELRLCHNALAEAPPTLAPLTALRLLDMGHNTELRELPGGIGQLLCLRTLLLSHMRIKQLPPDLGGADGLVHLDLSHNRCGGAGGRLPGVERTVFGNAAAWAPTAPASPHPTCH